MCAAATALAAPAGASPVDITGVPMYTTPVTFNILCDYQPRAVALDVLAVAPPLGLAAHWSSNDGSTFSQCPITFEDSLQGQESGGSYNRVFTRPGVYRYSSAGKFGTNAVVYVKGPRAALTATPAVSYTTDPVTVGLDASGSFVTDVAPVPGIASYEFDWDNDGVFDQTGASPSAQHTFPGVGEFAVKVRVTDDQARADDEGVVVSIRRPGPPNPDAGAEVENPAGDSTVGSGTLRPRAFGKVTITAKSRIKIKVLRRKGFVIRVRVPRVGDRVRATLGIGKRFIVGRGSKPGGNGRTRTVRIKLSRSGKARLKKLKPKRLRLEVTVISADDDSVVRAKNIKLSR